MISGVAVQVPYWITAKKKIKVEGQEHVFCTYGEFIKGILRGFRCTKSLRVLFLHRRPPSWTTLVLYSRAVFIFNEPDYSVESPKQVEEARVLILTVLFMKNDIIILSYIPYLYRTVDTIRYLTVRERQLIKKKLELMFRILVFLLFYQELRVTCYDRSKVVSVPMERW